MKKNVAHCMQGIKQGWYQPCSSVPSPFGRLVSAPRLPHYEPHYSRCLLDQGHSLVVDSHGFSSRWHQGLGLKVVRRSRGHGLQPTVVDSASVSVTNTGKWQKHKILLLMSQDVQENSQILGKYWSIMNKEYDTVYVSCSFNTFITRVNKKYRRSK